MSLLKLTLLLVVYVALDFSNPMMPGAVTFGDDSAPETTAAYSTHGVYVLRLTADDGGAQTSDDVTINVHPVNQAPIVNAGTDQTITLPASANLNATVNDDGWPQPPGHPDRGSTRRPR